MGTGQFLARDAQRSPSVPRRLRPVSLDLAVATSAVLIPGVTAWCEPDRLGCHGAAASLGGRRASAPAACVLRLLRRGSGRRADARGERAGLEEAVAAA